MLQQPYGFGEAEGEALDSAALSFSFFLALAFSSAAFSASVFGPSLTVFASSEPSVTFQYDPRASSFATTSLIVAAAPALVMTVLSVILKTRECSFPAMVKVFARLSTAEIIPWNGIARALSGSVVVLPAGDADGLVFGAGVAFVFGVALGFAATDGAALGVGDGAFLLAP